MAPPEDPPELFNIQPEPEAELRVRLAHELSEQVARALDSMLVTHGFRAWLRVAFFRRRGTHD